MAKAKVKEIVERDGRQIVVYDSGLERDKETGKIVKPAAHALITPEKANLYHRRRQEKAAALLRQRIRDAHNSVMPSQVTTSAEAFAMSGAMLYEEITLNSDAYPRDRLETWEKLGKYADVLPADMRQGSNEPTMQQATELTDAIAGLIRAITDATQRTSADVVDVDNYANGDSD